MAIRITPEEAQEKHARRLKAATEDIRRGIDRVTESPTAKAAAKADKMLQKVSESVQSGKWAAGLRRVSLEEWKEQTRDKGVNRIAAGIDASADKVTSFFTDLFGYQDKGLAEIARMPDMTLEDSISRATAWMRYMSKFRRS